MPNVVMQPLNAFALSFSWHLTNSLSTGDLFNDRHQRLIHFEERLPVSADHPLLTVQATRLNWNANRTHGYFDLASDGRLATANRT
jgi:hypothetical protein